MLPDFVFSGGHGNSKGEYLEITENKIGKWLTIPWQYCPVCRMMLVD